LFELYLNNSRLWMNFFTCFELTSEVCSLILVPVYYMNNIIVKSKLSNELISRVDDCPTVSRVRGRIEDVTSVDG